jgi:hypothetical protein
MSQLADALGAADEEVSERAENVEEDDEEDPDDFGVAG